MSWAPVAAVVVAAVAASAAAVAERAEAAVTIRGRSSRSAILALALVFGGGQACLAHPPYRVVAPYAHPGGGAFELLGRDLDSTQLTPLVAEEAQLEWRWGIGVATEPRCVIRVSEYNAASPTIRLASGSYLAWRYAYSDSQFPVSIEQTRRGSTLAEVGRPTSVSPLSRPAQEPPILEGYDLRMSERVSYSPDGPQFLGLWVREDGQESVLALFDDAISMRSARTPVIYPRLIARTDQALAAVSVSPGFHGETAMLSLLTEPDDAGRFQILTYEWAGFVSRN